MTRWEVVKIIVENIDARIDAYASIVAKTSNKRRKHTAFSIAAELTDLKNDIQRSIKNEF